MTESIFVNKKKRYKTRVQIVAESKNFVQVKYIESGLIKWMPLSTFNSRYQEEV